VKSAARRHVVRPSPEQTSDDGLGRSTPPIAGASCAVHQRVSLSSFVRLAGRLQRNEPADDPIAATSARARRRSPVLNARKAMKDIEDGRDPPSGAAACEVHIMAPAIPPRCAPCGLSGCLLQQRRRLSKSNTFVASSSNRRARLSHAAALRRVGDPLRLPADTMRRCPRQRPHRPPVSPARFGAQFTHAPEHRDPPPFAGIWRASAARRTSRFALWCRREDWRPRTPFGQPPFVSPAAHSPLSERPKIRPQRP
jgi:hypothetical protein